MLQSQKILDKKNENGSWISLSSQIDLLKIMKEAATLKEDQYERKQNKAQQYSLYDGDQLQEDIFERLTNAME